MRLRLSGLTVMALTLAGCGCALSAKLQAATSHIERAAHELATRSDADSLAAAGALTPDKARSLSLIARAAKVAPTRADLAWLHAQICAEVAACNPEPIERHVRELDASNGIGWFGTLNRAHTSGNNGTELQALQGLALSPHVDIYWTTLVARLSSAAASTADLTLPEAEREIIGFLAARAIPGLKAVSDACTGERLEGPGVREMCRSVAQALQHGDTYIMEMMGDTIAKRVWPEGSPEWKDAGAARRTFEYRLGRWQKMEATLLGESASRRYLVLCAQNRREQDVLTEELVEAGENPNPPTN